MEFGTILSYLSALLIFGRQVYWIFLEIEANAQKITSRTPTLSDYFKRFAANAVTVLIIVQLLGYPVVPFTNNLFLQIIGFLMVMVGTYISIAGRRDLGSNWTHATEAQIKKGHELVTHGMYRYIRHPIYAGMFLTLVGAELVAGSYLAIVLAIVFLIVGYRQSKIEEELLIRQFGKRYLEYMKTSQMFIPRVW